MNISKGYSSFKFKEFTNNEEILEVIKTILVEHLKDKFVTYKETNFDNTQYKVLSLTNVYWGFNFHFHNNVFYWKNSLNTVLSWIQNKIAQKIAEKFGIDNIYCSLKNKNEKLYFIQSYPNFRLFHDELTKNSNFIVKIMLILALKTNRTYNDLNKLGIIN